MKDEDRIKSLEAKVRHLQRTFDTMVDEYNKTLVKMQEVYGLVIEPEINDDSWYSIEGMPKEYREYASSRIEEIKENDRR